MPENDYGFELAKLIIAAITPLVVVFMGFLINKRIKDLEQYQWSNQKVIEKRIDFYFQVAPLLNDIRCFYTYVGVWKNIAPTDILERKRDLDRVFNITSPLLPPQVLVSYQKFIDECFETFTGWGEDAKLRTSFSRRKEVLGSNWDSSWDKLFDKRNSSDPNVVQDLYASLMFEVASSLGVGLDLSPTLTARVPRNIHIENEE